MQFNTQTFILLEIKKRPEACQYGNFVSWVQTFAFLLVKEDLRWIVMLLIIQISALWASYGF